MRAAAFVPVLLLACAPPSGAPDAGDDTTPDAAEETTADAGDVDAGGTVDAGPTLPLDGFGAITGDCDVIDTELLDTDEHVFRNHIDFGTNPFDSTDEGALSEGGDTLYNTPNAGGSSGLSEVFSFEVLHRCELATLLKTETQIDYAIAGKITDLLVQMDDHRVGVSVTRAVGYPRDAEYTLATAKSLVEKKLNGINESTVNVAASDRWVKQILHVIAYEDRHADRIIEAWNAVDDALRADTILLVTVSDGSDEFIYSN